MSNQPELCLKIYFVPHSKHSPSRNNTNMHLNSSNLSNSFELLPFSLRIQHPTQQFKSERLSSSETLCRMLYTL